jgi:hypothetical protein
VLSYDASYAAAAAAAYAAYALAAEQATAKGQSASSRTKDRDSFAAAERTTAPPLRFDYTGPGAGEAPVSLEPPSQSAGPGLCNRYTKVARGFVAPCTLPAYHEGPHEP